MMVKREKTVREFHFQKFGENRFCYTICFADCLHELQEIISGTKLCLVFNLAKRDSSMDPTYREYISNQALQVEAALEPWLEGATGGRLNVFPRKLFIPLRHKYTHRSFSFDVLKEDDKIVAEMLKNCKDKNNEKLDLHMCQVTKYESGDASPRSGKDHHCSNECCHMWISNFQDVEITNWIGLDTKPVSVQFKDLIDMEKEVVVDEGGGPFYSQPDEEEYIVATAYGQYPLMKHWYERSMLVAWPKGMSVCIACEIDVSGALDLLEDTLKITDPKFSAQLHQVVCFCDEKHSLWQYWVSTSICLNNILKARLLDLCRRAWALEHVLHIFQLLVDGFSHAWESSELHVAVSVSVAKLMSTSAKVFGWASMSWYSLTLHRDLPCFKVNSLGNLQSNWYGQATRVLGSL